jgi:hypothetical protein
MDYLPASQVLALASRDECLRQLMLRFVVDKGRGTLKPFEARAQVGA